MRVSLLILLTVLVAAGQAATTTYAGHKAWIVKGAGTTTVKTNIGGEPLTVTVHTWQVPVDDRDSAAPHLYPQCSYTQDPCSIANSMRVRLGDRDLWMGSNAIAGLGDMHYLYVSGSPARLVLVIIGGDTAESYEAHLIFNHEGLVERILYGLDLKHPYEVSRFYSINIGS